MKSPILAAALVAATFAMPIAAQAQSIPEGIAHGGSVGMNTAGPIGAVVGGAGTGPDMGPATRTGADCVVVGGSAETGAAETAGEPAVGGVPGVAATGVEAAEAAGAPDGGASVTPQFPQ